MFVWWHDYTHFFLSFAGFLFGMGVAWTIYLLKKKKNDEDDPYAAPNSFLGYDWPSFLFLLFISGCTFSALFCGISAMIARSADIADLKPWRTYGK